MHRRLKGMEPPSVGQKMILAATSFGNKVESSAKRIDCVVTESSEHLITVEANGQSYQFTQQDWDPVSIRPKFQLFPSNECLDELFEIAELRSKICVAFNFTSGEKGEFTLEQLRGAAKALGIIDG